MSRAVVSFIVIIVFAALFGGAYWSFVAQAKPPGGGHGMPPGFATPVEVAEVTVQPAKKTVFAVGTLESSQSVIVRAEVSGRVAELNLPEGQVVKLGHVLVRLDASMERAQLQQARAALDLARANFKRADELMKRGSGTVRTLDEAVSQLKVEEATVALMAAQLEKLTVVAPFDGVLGLKHVSVGDYLGPGAEIINLEMIDPLRVEFRVPELFLPAVAVGNKVSLAIDAFPGREFTGEVYAIDPLIDKAGRAIVMRARIANPKGELKPGLFARVTLELTSNPSAIFVPEESLVPIGDTRFVFKVVDKEVDGKTSKVVAFVPVKTGTRGHGQVEISVGLAPKDVVVTAGVLKIYEGAAVMPLPPPGAATPPPPAEAAPKPAEPAKG